VSSPRYWLIGRPVLDYVDRFAPDSVYHQFYDLIEALMEFGPYPEDQPGLGILPLQDPGKPNGFTAPFDRGLLAYQVMLDQPAIKLVDVFWLTDDEADTTGADYAF
jgi:hypothetical protein